MSAPTRMPALEARTADEAVAEGPRRGLAGGVARLLGATLVSAVALLLASCGPIPEPSPLPPPPPGHLQELTDGRYPPAPLPGLQALLPAPGWNRPTPERVVLGKRLFFDPVFSRDFTVSCASCHRPDLAFADTLPRSPGVEGRTGSRTTPSLVNRGYGGHFFWDGRAESLEEAVLLPVENPLELDLELEALVERLRADSTYRALFARAYPEGAPAEGRSAVPAGDGASAAAGGSADETGRDRRTGDPDRDGAAAGSITTRTLGAALASYVRLIRSGGAPEDRHAAGDTAALSPEALQGRRLFLGKANCSACHAGPAFTDDEFHNTGVAARSARGDRSRGTGPTPDPGRYAVTGREEDRGAFKTPGLREVARTAPYMHDGSLATLEEVIAFYDEGGEPNPNLSDDIEPLGLTAEERRALVAFLEEALTGIVDAP